MIYNLFIGNTVQGLSGGFAVLKIIGAMVLGMVAVFSLPRSMFRRHKKVSVVMQVNSKIASTILTPPEI